MEVFVPTVGGSLRTPSWMGDASLKCGAWGVSLSPARLPPAPLHLHFSPHRCISPSLGSSVGLGSARPPSHIACGDGGDALEVWSLAALGLAWSLMHETLLAWFHPRRFRFGFFVGMKTEGNCSQKETWT